MQLRRCRSSIVVVALAAACGHAVAPEVPPPAQHPRLVVLLVIDQLPIWSFDRKVVSARGGVARLVRDGVLFRAARYPYATTATSVGHAALASGAAPERSGIIGNKWYERGTPEQPGGEIEVIEDARWPLLEAAASKQVAEPLHGASPHRLEVESVGDALLRASGGTARAVSLSLKSRAAILMGGQHPTLAVWYQHEQAAFTTSRYYAERLPSWLSELARTTPVEPRLADYVWTPLDAESLASRTGLPDDAPGERGKLGLMGATFPHRLASAPDPSEAVEATPLADEIVLEAALAALPGEHLGEDDVPDLLCLSFSAHDYVGHGWGLESWESADQFARLDGAIGRLLAALDEHVGRGRWALVLASDHGGTPVPEHTGGSAAHVDPDKFRAPLDAVARATVGPGDWIAFVTEQWVYLSPAARALPDGPRGKLVDALVATLRVQPGVAVALRTDSVRGDCDRRSGIAALVCRAAHARVGEVFWAPPPGSVAMKLPWDATNHISPNPSDRAIPIVVVAPGVRGGRVVTNEVSPLQVAATLAALLGVAPPRNAERRDPLPGLGL